MAANDVGLHGLAGNAEDVRLATTKSTAWCVEYADFLFPLSGSRWRAVVLLNHKPYVRALAMLVGIRDPACGERMSEADFTRLLYDAYQASKAVDDFDLDSSNAASVAAFEKLQAESHAARAALVGFAQIEGSSLRPENCHALRKGDTRFRGQLVLTEEQVKAAILEWLRQRVAFLAVEGVATWVGFHFPGDGAGIAVEATVVFDKKET